MTCDRWIPVVRPHLSDALVDDRALERLRTVARYLPGDCLGVIEVRLAASPPGRREETESVDLSVRLSEPPQARLLLEHLSPPHLRGLFSSGWREIGYPSPVSSVWLEFDLDHEPGGLPVPLVAARLSEQVASSWLVETLLPSLHGRSLDASQRRWVRRAVDELPAGIQLLYAFSLLSRPGADVRLELFGHDSKNLLDFLGHLASGETARRVADLAPLLEGADRYHLSFDVDVGGTIGPRIGLECGFARLPHRESRWLTLFDRLVTAELCTATKRDAVFEWPGYDTVRTAARVWPREEEALDRYCVRCLSHVKLVSRPDLQPEAKAYLLFQPLGSRPQPDDDGSGAGRLSSSASARTRSA